jgi:hypothetical protein
LLQVRNAKVTGAEYAVPSALDSKSLFFNLSRWPRLLHLAPLALKKLPESLAKR